MYLRKEVVNAKGTWKGRPVLLKDRMRFLYLLWLTLKAPDDALGWIFKISFYEGPPVIDQHRLNLKQVIRGTDDERQSYHLKVIFSRLENVIDSVEHFLICIL